MKNRYKDLFQSAQLINAGLIDELNGYKLGFNPQSAPSRMRQAYTKMLTASDLAQCVNRYVWDLKPVTNLTSQEIESLFYQCGALCFFREGDHLIISPFALLGELNPYGRLTEIQPIDLGGHVYGPVRGVIDSDGSKVSTRDEAAVVIYDYTHFYQPGYETSRRTINQNSTIEDQVNVFVQLRTNIDLSVKKALALCDNEDQKSQVLRQVSTLLHADAPIIPISKGKGGVNGQIEMFNFDNNFNTQNYCQQIDYYDKIRRQFNGVPTPDTFEKKERKITEESENSNVHTSLMLIDGYTQRFAGLEMCKKYLKLDGIESCSVEINDILKIHRPEWEIENEEI